MNTSPVIYTDLDGTLLDHDTYSADEAREVLGQLSAVNIPVVPATSKTYAEVAEFRTQMGLNNAFIVENGAAIYVPMSLNIRCPMGSKIFEDFWVREFGVRRQALCDVIEALDMSSAFDFKSLNEMRPSEVADITGLDIESAKRAQLRLYSETIDWRDSVEALEKFTKVLTDIGFAVSHGGRFVHLMGPNNKGIAVRWFHNLLKRAWTPDLVSIAAGDAPNDREMLEGADYALIMRNERGTPLSLDRSGATYVSDGSGPSAWAAGIREIFRTNGWNI